MVAAPPPSPPAIVRQWSAALNRNDNAAAAQLFASGARIVRPGSFDVRATQSLVLAFNESLPCAGKIVHLTVSGNRVVATFVLGERPKHRCDGPGQKAAALFVVRDGKITFWEQVPVPQQKSGLPA